MADKALMVGAFGARGTGKTTWVKHYIRKSKIKRVVIWDYKHDPNLEDVGTPYLDIREIGQAMKAKTFCIRFLVDKEAQLHPIDMHEQFRVFCELCWQASNLLMFVDELPEVTKANKAPDKWRTCVNVGREYKIDGKPCALTIVIAAQRPAEVDKSTIGNCDIIHCGRVRGNDAKVLAVELQCTADELVSMPDYHYVETGPGNTGTRRGVMTLNGPVENKSARAPQQTGAP